jgi:hypothetical protein
LPQKVALRLGCDSPILLDLDNDGFHLTDLGGGVVFDLDADGHGDHVAWTTATSNDAFLCLDRNQNGKIDNGRELFGNVTPQAQLPDPADYNGYLALDMYDRHEFGGNDDGYITSADAVYSLLRLWVDANHDGSSTPSELTTLANRHVTSIQLAFVESIQADGFGNEFRYVSSAVVNGATRYTTDVFFVTE